MMESRQLTKLCGNILSEATFDRKGKCWYKRANDLIALVDLQKSNYSNLYFINLGFFLLNLGSKDYPKEHECHVRIRAEKLFPVLCPAIDEAFNLDSTKLCDQERQGRIEDIFRGYIVPFCETNCVFNNLRDSYFEGRFMGGMVHRRAKELFGEPIS